MAWIKADSETEQRYFDYLERLRQSGSTNMFGAGPYLQREFRIARKTAHKVMGRWMRYHSDAARQLPGPGGVAVPKQRPPRTALICQGGYCDGTEIADDATLCERCEHIIEQRDE